VIEIDQLYAGSLQRQRGRYVPAAVRREVYQRDGARCTHVDARGLRCAETRYLELHHLLPFARNGAHVASNLALRCSAHNALAAEEDFGRDFVVDRRRPGRHEACAQNQFGRP
jgi:5-methylcytosine-specific restriction endonuclease McrA